MNSYIFIFIYSIYLIFFLIVDQIIPGYGGDQYGLYNLFLNDKGFDELGIFDNYFKRIINLISFGNPIISVFLCFLIPFILNSVCGILAFENFSFYTKTTNIKNFFFKLFIIFEPLTFALLLSGHVYFLTNVCLFFAVKFDKLKFVLQILVTILLLFINAYLLTGLVLFIFIFSMQKKIFPIKYFSIILVVIFSKIIIELYFPFLIANLFGLNTPGRLIPSGIFPFNFFLPDINSFSGSFTLSIKNLYYTYLNVPEANYSLLLPIILIISFVKYNRWIIFLFISCSLIFFLPPTTRYLEGIIFPSFIFNFIFPELRILSRNFSFIYILMIIYIYKYSNSLNKNLSILILLISSILFLPISIPFINFNDSSALRECNDSVFYYFIDTQKKPWDQYYSEFYNNNIVVFETLSSNKNLDFCDLFSR